MRTLALAAISLCAICGTALSADLSRPPPMYNAPVEPYISWSGFYLGLNAGGGIGNGRSDFSIAGGPAFATGNNSLPGAIGGAPAGFDGQSGMAVVGVETDFPASGRKGRLTAPCLALCGLPLTATYSQKVPWFGTVRGRLGVAASGWL